MTTENTQTKKFGSLVQGLGITGLVIGILALLVSFIPCFGVYALIIGIIAIVFAVAALAIALKHDHPKGLIIAALITAFLGCGIAYSQYAAMQSAGETFKEELEKTIIENGGSIQ